MQYGNNILQYIRKDISVIKNRMIVLRAEHRWSQETLAKKVGVTRQTISSIENGKYGLSLELAFKIANTFDVDITDVFQQVSDD